MHARGRACCIGYGYKQADLLLMFFYLHRANKDTFNICALITLLYMFFIDVARTLKEGNKGVVGCLLRPSARPSTCENKWLFGWRWYRIWLMRWRSTPPASRDTDSFFIFHRPGSLHASAHMRLHQPERVGAEGANQTISFSSLARWIQLNTRPLHLGNLALVIALYQTNYVFVDKHISIPI